MMQTMGSDIALVQDGVSVQLYHNALRWPKTRDILKWEMSNFLNIKHKTTLSYFCIQHIFVSIYAKYLHLPITG